MSNAAQTLEMADGVLQPVGRGRKTVTIGGVRHRILKATSKMVEDVRIVDGNSLWFHDPSLDADRIEMTTVRLMDAVDLIVDADSDAVGWICPSCRRPVLAEDATYIDGRGYCCRSAFVEWEADTAIVGGVPYRIERQFDSWAGQTAYCINGVAYVEDDVDAFSTIYSEGEMDVLLDADGGTVGFVCPVCGKGKLLDVADTYNGFRYCCLEALMDM